LDSTFIVSFVGAIKNVFSTMLNTEVTFSKPHMKSPGTACSGVSGIIAFTGTVSGSIVVSLPVEVAAKLVKQFAGLELPPDHPDFADAVGELVNMIAGGAKANFKMEGVAISCPSVVVGKDHQVFHRKDEPIIVIPCLTALGQFGTEISLRTEANTAAAVRTA
jgi:chemotaxis protein CheX